MIRCAPTEEIPYHDTHCPPVTRRFPCESHTGYRMRPVIPSLLRRIPKRTSSASPPVLLPPVKPRALHNEPARTRGGSRNAPAAVAVPEPGHVVSI